MAVKIKLMRLGKIRAPYYRIVVADSRTKRDGRAIETIGKYHPTQDPSLIEVDSERAQYWLGVGAQPTEPVAAILKVTGDWQKFKGLPGAEGTLRVAEPKADKKTVFEAAAKESLGEAEVRRHHAEEEGRQEDRCRRGRSGRRGACCRGTRLPRHLPLRRPLLRRPPLRHPLPRRLLRTLRPPTSRRPRADRARRGARAPGARHRRAPGRRVGPRPRTPVAAARSRSGSTPTTSAR